MRKTLQIKVSPFWFTKAGKYITKAFILEVALFLFCTLFFAFDVAGNGRYLTGTLMGDIGFAMFALNIFALGILSFVGGVWVLTKIAKWVNKKIPKIQFISR